MKWTEAALASVDSQIKADLSRRLARNAPRRPGRYKIRKIQRQREEFDSVREMKAWKAFRLQQRLGGIRAVIRKVTMPMPASRRRLRIEFLIIENCGKHRWYDASSHTSEFELKAGILKSAYGITLELI